MGIYIKNTLAYIDLLLTFRQMGLTYRFEILQRIGTAYMAENSEVITRLLETDRSQVLAPPLISGRNLGKF